MVSMGWVQKCLECQRRVMVCAASGQQGLPCIVYSTNPWYFNITVGDQVVLFMNSLDMCLLLQERPFAVHRPHEPILPPGKSPATAGIQQYALVTWHNSHQWLHFPYLLHLATAMTALQTLALEPQQHMRTHLVTQDAFALAPT